MNIRDVLTRICRIICELKLPRRRHTCVYLATVRGSRELFFNIWLKIRTKIQKYYNNFDKNTNRLHSVQSSIFIICLPKYRYENIMCYVSNTSYNELYKRYLYILYWWIVKTVCSPTVWIIIISVVDFLISDRVINRLTFLILYMARYQRMIDITAYCTCFVVNPDEWWLMIYRFKRLLHIRFRIFNACENGLHVLDWNFNGTSIIKINILWRTKVQTKNIKSYNCWSKIKLSVQRSTIEFMLISHLESLTKDCVNKYIIFSKSIFIWIEIDCSLIQHNVFICQAIFHLYHFWQNYCLPVCNLWAVACDEIYNIL